MKATVCEITNKLDGSNSILDITEEKIREFEDLPREIVKNEAHRKKI